MANKKRATKPRKTAVASSRKRTREMLPRKAKEVVEDVQEDMSDTELASHETEETDPAPEVDHDNGHNTLEMEDLISYSTDDDDTPVPTAAHTHGGTTACATCFYKKTPEQMVRREDIPRRCRECYPTICHVCLETYLVQYFFKFKGNTLNFSCPCCSNIWDMSMVEKLMGSTKFAACLERLAHRSLESSPTFRWCAADKCTSGQFYDEDQVKVDNKKICCGHCESVNCFDCRAVWHEGLSCKEFQDPDLRKHRGKRASNSEVRKAMRKSETKRCPHCSTAIEKSDGCDSVFCKKPCRP